METSTMDLSIPDLIHYARVDKNLALPEFQRGYDWDADAVAEMLRTVISNWPSGSILLMGGQRAAKKLPAISSIDLQTGRGNRVGLSP